MKTYRQSALSVLGALLSASVLALALPVFAPAASAAPSDFKASVVDGPIPATLDDIPLTEAPSFTGADEGIIELRSTVATYLGTVQLNHTGAFYGRAGSESEFCYVGCSMNGAEQAFSLTFSLPAGTTAFAVRLNPQDGGATTYTVTGPEGATAQFERGARGSSTQDSRPTLAVSATNGSTIDSITITATQADGCTFQMMEEEPPMPCYLYGLDIADVAIGSGVTSVTTTTEPAVPTTLASTGTDVSMLAALSLVLMGLGLALTVTERRRSRWVR